MPVLRPLLLAAALAACEGLLEAREADDMRAYEVLESARSGLSETSAEAARVGAEMAQKLMELGSKLKTQEALVESAATQVEEQGATVIQRAEQHLRSAAAQLKETAQLTLMLKEALAQSEAKNQQLEARLAQMTLQFTQLSNARQQRPEAPQAAERRATHSAFEERLHQFQQTQNQATSLEGMAQAAPQPLARQHASLLQYNDQPLTQYQDQAQLYSQMPPAPTADMAQQYEDAPSLQQQMPQTLQQRPSLRSFGSASSVREMARFEDAEPRAAPLPAGLDLDEMAERVLRRGEQHLQDARRR